MNEPDLLINDVFLPNSHSLFNSLVSIINWDERIQARKTASFGSPYNYSYWKHGILKQPETFGRISLTFRLLV
ncbi:MAG: hypothetical protein V7K53_27355 [Nostoc sp.]|uniref:hypothetical protein n=1 Tax=Nostoc sp. TaxID=1180 RepID=UPI002FF75795